MGFAVNSTLHIYATLELTGNCKLNRNGRGAWKKSFLSGFWQGALHSSLKVSCNSLWKTRSIMLSLHQKSWGTASLLLSQINHECKQEYFIFLSLSYKLCKDLLSISLCTYLLTGDIKKTNSNNSELTDWMFDYW